MKLIRSTISPNLIEAGERRMGNARKSLSVFCFQILVILLFFCHLSALAQETGYGLSLSVEMEKKLSRFFDLKVEEEIRLLDNEIYFDRSVTAVGIDYSFFGKKLKLGAYYSYLYLYNNNRYFEPRHRYFLNVSYKETLEQFTFSWRGRFQSSYRDENIGEYKINPKHLLKNKFQVNYAIWGRPYTPFISCDLSGALNNPRGNYLTRFRYQAGVVWRLNRTDFMDFFLRYDHYTDSREPKTLSIGAGWKVKW